MDAFQSFYLNREYRPGFSTTRVTGYGAQRPCQGRSTREKCGEKSNGGDHFRGKQLRFNVKRVGKDKRKFHTREGRIIDPDQCIVCMEYGCHSSRHKAALFAFLTAASYDSEDHVDSESDEENTREDVQSCSHASFLLNASVCLPVELQSTAYMNFPGLLLDTGTSVLSTVRLKWLPTLRTISGHPLLVRNRPEDRVHIGGVGNISVSTKGSVMFPFPFGYVLYQIVTYLVDGYSPFLLSHRDMDSHGLSYHSLEKFVIRPKDGYKKSVTWYKNSPYLPLGIQCHLSDTELIKLLRGLGHSTSGRTISLLRAADLDRVTPDVHARLEEIIRTCRACQLKAPPPPAIPIFLKIRRYWRI